MCFFADTPSVIEAFVAEGDKVIITTSFDFVSATQNAALNNPGVRFLTCSGFLTGPNMGSYFVRMEQPQYLAGLVAGSMTRSHPATRGYGESKPRSSVL